LWELGNHDGLGLVSLVGQPFQQGLPNLLGYKGHERVQQAQGAFQNVGQCGHWRRGCAGAHPNLRHLYIPITVVVPDEVVQLLLRLTQFEGFQGMVDLFDGLVQAADDPSVFPVLRGRQVEPAVEAIFTLNAG